MFKYLHINYYLKGVKNGKSNDKVSRFSSRLFDSLDDEANLLVGFEDGTEGIFENWVADEERPFNNWTEAVKDIVSVQGYKNINQIEAV